MYTYLILNLLTISYPLAQSFERRLRFAREWMALLASITVTGTLFILWDAWFTSEGVWGFNPAYHLSLKILGLPMEEWLFFVTVPYACLFIHEVLQYFFPKDHIADKAKWIATVIGGLLLVGSVAFLPRYYTSITFGLCGIYLLIQAWWIRPKWLGRFFRTYSVTLIPFLAVNGILTGSFIEDQVVWYSADHILGVRIFTIPVEDVIYNLFMLLIHVQVYEWVKQRRLAQEGG